MHQSSTTENKVSIDESKCRTDQLSFPKQMTSKLGSER